MTSPKTPGAEALTEWTFCTEHEIVVRSGICRLCNGARNLIQVVPKSQLAAATERAERAEAAMREVMATSGPPVIEERDAAQRDRDAYKRVLEACDEAAQRIRLRVDSRPADTVFEAEFHELLDEQARGIQARIRAVLSSSSEPRKGGET